MKTLKRQSNFFLSVQIYQDLQSAVPKGKQSEFVENSLRASLSSLKFQQALQHSFGAWKGRKESTENFVRRLRKTNRLSVA